MPVCVSVILCYFIVILLPMWTLCINVLAIVCILCLLHSVCIHYYHKKSGYFVSISVSFSSVCCFCFFVVVVVGFLYLYNHLFVLMFVCCGCFCWLSSHKKLLPSGLVFHHLKRACIRAGDEWSQCCLWLFYVSLCVYACVCELPCSGTSSPVLW